MPSDQEIIRELSTGLKPSEVAKKFEVSMPRISQAKKNNEFKKLKAEIEEYKQQTIDLNHELRFFTDLVKRKAILAYPDKMTPEEIAKWEAL